MKQMRLRKMAALVSGAALLFAIPSAASAFWVDYPNSFGVFSPNNGAPFWDAGWSDNFRNEAGGWPDASASLVCVGTRCPVRVLFMRPDGSHYCVQSGYNSIGCSAARARSRAKCVNPQGSPIVYMNCRKDRA